MNKADFIVKLSEELGTTKVDSNKIFYKMRSSYDEK
jgi:hypothetical protein